MVRIYYLFLPMGTENKWKKILERKHNPESFNRETVLLGTCETLQN